MKLAISVEDCNTSKKIFDRDQEIQLERKGRAIPYRNIIKDLKKVLRIASPLIIEV